MFRRSLMLTVVLASGCTAEQFYQRALNAVDAPGAEMSVRSASGDAWSGATGIATEGEPMTTDRTLLIGSNTKMLTTAVVLQLAEEGAIGLDDPASRWVPGLRDDITVRELLQHRSGMGEYFDNEVFADGSAYGDEWSPEELLALGRAVADTGPTEAAHYANTNFIAAGLIVEAVEGRPFQDVLDDRVFGALDMRHSGLLVHGDPMPGDLAWGAGGTLGVPVTWDPSVGWAAGSAWSRSDDMVRFMDAVFDFELYGADLLAEQLEPVPWGLYDSEGVTSEYGLGIMIVDVDGALVYGHLGSAEGFGSAVLSDAATGAVSVVLTNQTDPGNAVMPALDALHVAATN